MDEIRGLLTNDPLNVEGLVREGLVDVMCECVTGERDTLTWLESVRLQYRRRTAPVGWFNRPVVLWQLERVI